MAKFRLLHISDLHFGHYANRPPLLPVQWKSPKDYLEVLHEAFQNEMFVGSHTEGKSDQLARFIEKEANDIDAIIITGDIATTGANFDLQKALEFIEGDPKAIHDEIDLNLKKYKEKIVLLPGNHDRYDQSKKGGNGLQNVLYFPGNNLFYSFFKEYCKEKVTLKILEKDNSAIGLITADFTLNKFQESTHPKYINMFAQGKVHKEVLERLVKATNDFTNNNKYKNKVVIWAIHFPPCFPKGIFLDLDLNFPKIFSFDIADIFKKYNSMLLGRKKLIRAAKKCKVSCILSGHLHQSFKKDISSNLCIYGTGTATQYSFREYMRDEHNIEFENNASEANCFHLLSISINDLGVDFDRTCYEFNAIKLEFVKK